MWRNILWIAAFLAVSCGKQSQAAPAQSASLYTTWSTLELDKCASAWLIKRFVDPEAVFRFVPEGELIRIGTPFDTPDATLTRTHEHTTYESIVLVHEIEDPAVVAIGAWVRAIEIDYWGSVKDSEALVVDAEIRRIIEKASDEQEALEESFVYLDRLYEKLAGSLPAGTDGGGEHP